MLGDNCNLDLRNIRFDDVFDCLSGLNACRVEGIKKAGKTPLTFRLPQRL